MVARFLIMDLAVRFIHLYVYRKMKEQQMMRPVLYAPILQ